MPFIPVANTVMVEERMTMDLQQVENTQFFEFGGAPSISDMNDLGDAIISWWAAFYAPLVFGGVQLREVVVTDLTTATSGQVTRVPTVTTPGELNEAALPSNVTMTVSFRTDQRGRSFRGRNYIAGLVETQTISQNLVNPDLVADWIAAYTQLITVPSIVAATWVIVSRFSGVDGDGKPIPRAAGVTTPVTAVTVVDNVVDSQRRRLPGRGR